MSTVTINVLAYGSGRVYVSSGSGGYLTVTAGDNFIAQYGERVRFFAVPNTGYKFVRFDSGSSISTTQNPFNPVVTQSGTIIARFEPITAAGTLSISNLTVGVSQDPDFPSSQGYIQGTVTGTGSGTYTIKVDGSQIAQRMFPSVSTFIIQVSQGQHTICANTVCRTINVGGSSTTAVRKTLITNLTSNETLISAAVMFETGTGLLTRPRFIRKYQVSEGYAFEYEFPSDTSWTQFIAIGATRTSGGAGLAKFVTQNAGKIALLITSVFSFVIIWKWLDVESQQIEVQAKISDNTKDSITEILTDPTIPSEDKKKLIELILKGASGVTPTDWSLTITTGVIIIAGAYIVSEFIKNKKKEK